MAVISLELGYLFIQAPRTGCTAIETGILLPHGKGHRFPAQDIVDPGGRLLVQSKHCTVSHLLHHRLISRPELRRLYKFATVRNPWDSTLSLYTKMRNQYAPLLNDPSSWVHGVPNYGRSMAYAAEHSFDDWVVYNYSHGYKWQSRLKRGMRTILKSPGGHSKGMDFVMRFESLSIDLATVTERVGIQSNLALPRINVTSGRGPGYRDAYSERSKEIVGAIYAPLIRRFGYAF